MAMGTLLQGGMELALLKDVRINYVHDWVELDIAEVPREP
jgi:hypothetical protein